MGGWCGAYACAAEPCLPPAATHPPTPTPEPYRPPTPQETIFKEFYDLWPTKFQNKTNGVCGGGEGAGGCWAAAWGKGCTGGREGEGGEGLPCY